MYVGAQESFLINVLTIVFRAGEMNGEAKDSAVVFLDQLFEGCDIALLRCPNQPRVIHSTGASLLRRRHRGQFTEAFYVVRYLAKLICSMHDLYPISCSGKQRSGAIPIAQHRLLGAAGLR